MAAISVKESTFATSNCYDLNILLPNDGTRQEISIDDDIVSNLTSLIANVITATNIVKFDARDPSEDSMIMLKNNKTLAQQGIEDDADLVLKAQAPIPVGADLSTIPIAMWWQYPRLEGYLLKKGEKGPRKDWKKRWFSLRGNKLYYFKNEEAAQSGQPISFINLREVQSACVSRETSGVPKECVNNVFQIDVQRRIYYLLAKSGEDKERWLKGIDLCCKVLSCQPLAPGGVITNNDGGDEEDGDDAKPELFVDVNSGFSSIEENVTSGYLQKMGEDVLKNWKNRYFVLKEMHLYYYKTETDDKYINFIPVSKIDRVDTTENMKKELTGCGFHIVCPGRTYYLIAQSPEDRQRWIEALLNSKSKLKK